MVQMSDCERQSRGGVAVFVVDAHICHSCCRLGQVDASPVFDTVIEPYSPKHDVVPQPLYSNLPGLKFPLDVSA
jgi:hypothetical protein